MFETNYEWVMSHDDYSVEDVRMKFKLTPKEAKWVSAVFVLAGSEGRIGYRDAFEKLGGVVGAEFSNGNLSAMATMSNLITNCSAVKASGEQIFSISEKLYNAFSHTSVDRVPMSMIEFPYSGYFVDTMSTFKQMGDLKGFYVRHDDDCIRVMSVTGPNVMNDIRTVDYGFFKVPTDGFESWGDCLKSFRLNNKEEISGRVDFKTMETMFSIVVNMSLYLKCSTVDKEVVPKIRSVSRSKKKVKKRKNSMRVTRLGYNYIGDDMGDTKKSVGGGVLTKQHVVRGHWRNQVCGENNSDRKVIFIKPYFKGPDVGESLMRKYKL